MTGPETAPQSVLRMLFSLLAVLVFIGLAAILLSEPGLPGPLAGLAAGARPASGIANPVTAVLLAFRGYDTLLEVHVLLLAVLGAWSLGTRPEPRTLLPVNEILLTLVRTLAPLLVLTAAYLVWLGTKAPGGAFQAGALLAGAGVLLALVDRHVPDTMAKWPLRTGLALGPAFFLAVGLAVMSQNLPFLHVPPDLSPLLAAIEIGAAVSIGLALTTLFGGGRPRAENGEQ